MGAGGVRVRAIEERRGALAAFFRISKIAGLLLVPDLLWTTFAAILNFSLWRLDDPRG